VENFERALSQTHTDPGTLIIRLQRVPFIDMTAILTLGAVIGKLRGRGVRVLLSEANARVLGKLRSAGVLDGGSPVVHAETLAAALGQAAALAATPGASAATAGLAP
jgi:SulP family sulfate permease